MFVLHFDLLNYALIIASKVEKSKFFKKDLTYRIKNQEESSSPPPATEVNVIVQI